MDAAAGRAPGGAAPTPARARRPGRRGPRRRPRGPRRAGAGDLQRHLHPGLPPHRQRGRRPRRGPGGVPAGLRGLRRFRGDAQFTTWLYRITANCSANLLAKRARTRTETLADDAPVVDVRPDHDPELRMAGEDERARVAARPGRAAVAAPAGDRAARHLRPAPRRRSPRSSASARRRPRCACTGPGAGCGSCSGRRARRGDAGVPGPAEIVRMPIDLAAVPYGRRGDRRQLAAGDADGRRRRGRRLTSSRACAARPRWPPTGGLLAPSACPAHEGLAAPGGQPRPPCSPPWTRRRIERPASGQPGPSGPLPSAASRWPPRRPGRPGVLVWMSRRLDLADTG